MATVLQNKKYQSCIDASNACFEACEYCVSECCLRADDVKGMVKCTQLCRDCADICVLSSQYMSRSSEFSYKICVQCADICDACAIECDNLTWICVNNAPKYVVLVLRSVVKWQYKRNHGDLFVCWLFTTSFITSSRYSFTSSLGRDDAVPVSSIILS